VIVSIVENMIRSSENDTCILDRYWMDAANDKTNRQDELTAYYMQRERDLQTNEFVCGVSPVTTI